MAQRRGAREGLGVSGGLLARIVASKRAEIAAAAPLEEGGFAPRDVRSVLARPAGESLRLLAEVKLRSPSAGPLSRALSPPARAVAYAEAGAAMVSVLCDGPFFDGSFADLAAARRALAEAGSSARVLAKEFVVDVSQIDRARAAGADAVLLIARIVSRAELATLASAARERGLEPLVEVMTRDELDAAVDAGARVIGVNARDLDTLAMDARRAASVLGAIPPGCVAVHLSGLKTADDVRAVARTRADAALVGEALMRQDDPRPLLAELVVAARNA